MDLEDSKMCLEIITERYKLKERKTIYGWKLFKRTWDSQTHLDGLFMGGQYLPGKTYIALRGKIFIDGTGESYPSGFHVFASKKDAELYKKRNVALALLLGVTYVVRKVKLEDVRILGKQMIDGAGRTCLANVYVGRVMTIVECLFGG